jgi:hypothetical protein
MDIGIRQNVFLIKDKIDNLVNTTITTVSSGSLAEGLDLPGSDMDIMYVFNNVMCRWLKISINFNKFTNERNV